MRLTVIRGWRSSFKKLIRKELRVLWADIYQNLSGRVRCNPIRAPSG